jgi:hypothetical protein
MDVTCSRALVELWVDLLLPPPHRHSSKQSSKSTVWFVPQARSFLFQRGLTIIGPHVKVNCVVRSSSTFRYRLSTFRYRLGPQHHEIISFRSQHYICLLYISYIYGYLTSMDPGKRWLVFSPGVCRDLTPQSPSEFTLLNPHPSAIATHC